MKHNKKPAVIVHNQVHKPLKRANQLNAEQEKVMIMYKVGKCTMPFCGKMTKLAAECLKSNINRYLKNHDMKLEGTFFYTR